MRYFVHTIQQGGCCDYTIGCGQSVVEIPASNLVEAANFIVASIMPLKGERSGDFGLTPDDIKKITIYEVNETYHFDIAELNTTFKEVLGRRAAAELEQSEHQQYETLKAKYG